MNNIVCQLFLVSIAPEGEIPFMKTSCITGEPSTPNIGLEPPALPFTLPL